MHWRERAQRRRAYNDPGHAHELTFCCVDRHPFLRAARACNWLADAINAARSKHEFALWAYAFMPDHVHLIVHPTRPGYDISPIIAAIKEPVGRKAIAYLREHNPAWVDRLTVQKGRRTETRFWQPGGGYDRNVKGPRTLARMIDYIHLNPVRKGLVEKPEGWKWSSAGWVDDREPNALKPDPIPPEWGVIEFVE